MLLDELFSGKAVLTVPTFDCSVDEGATLHHFATALEHEEIGQGAALLAMHLAGLFLPGGPLRGHYPTAHPQALEFR